MISEDQKSKKDNVVAISPLIDNFLIKQIFLPWLVLQTCRNQRENLLEITLEGDLFIEKVDWKLISKERFNFFLFLFKYIFIDVRERKGDGEIQKH